MVHSSAAPMELVWMSDKEWCLSRHWDQSGTWMLWSQQAHLLHSAPTPQATETLMRIIMRAYFFLRLYFISLH